MAQHFQPREKPDFWELLFQDEIWAPKDSDPIRLEDMTPEHRANLRAWLRSRAIQIAVAYECEPLQWINEWMSDTNEMFMEMESNGRMYEVNAVGHDAWLESTPLMKRLVELDKPPSLTAWEV